MTNPARKTRKPAAPKTRKPAAKVEVQEEEKKVRKMADVLRAARVGYEATKAYSGKSSLNNGDDLAKALSGMTPAQAMVAAEAVHATFDPDNVPDLVGKYGNLNPGQQRMNSGNRIRAAVKRGDISIKDAIKLIKAA